jgi:hypothetical protein
MQKINQKDKLGCFWWFGIIFGIFLVLNFLGLFPILFLLCIFFLLTKINKKLEKTGYKNMNLYWIGGESKIIENFFKKLLRKYDINPDTINNKEKESDDNDCFHNKKNDENSWKNGFFIFTDDLNRQSLLKFFKLFKRIIFFSFVVIIYPLVAYIISEKYFGIGTSENTIIALNKLTSININNVIERYLFQSNPIIRIVLAIMIWFIIYKVFRDYSKTPKK